MIDARDSRIGMMIGLAIGVVSRNAALAGSALRTLLV